MDINLAIIKNLIEINKKFLRVKYLEHLEDLQTFCYKNTASFREQYLN